MTIFGYILLSLGATSLLVGLFRRVEWLVGVNAIVLIIGVALTTASWYMAHYAPSPGGAGVIMKFSDEVEDALRIEDILTMLVWALPLIGYGIGAWLRQKIVAVRASHV